METIEQAFMAEARDVIETLEESLLGLDENGEDRELIDAAFRALHTLKGSGAMAGFREIERFAHHLESAFDGVRSGSRPLDSHLLSLTLRSIDHLAALVDAGVSAPKALQDASDALLAELSDGSTPSAKKGASASPKKPVVGEIWGLRAWLLEVSPEPDLLADGLDPLAILQGLERLGELALVGRFEEPPPLESLEPGHVHLSYSVLLIGEMDRPALDEALFFLQDRSLIRVELLAEDVRHDALSTLEDEVRDHLRDRNIEALKQILLDTPIHAQKQDKPAPPRKPAAAPPKDAPAGPASKEDTVKVPAGKLDILVDLVGEMVIAQARLQEISKRLGDPELLGVAEDLERMCANLRDSTMDLRMLPIGTTFSKFKRLVRDVSQQLGKKIQLVTDGEDTELDKTVIDKLGDPMIHLIRNSLDHGIESPEARVLAGKPETGTIWLSARHSETNVVIEVRDDGKGLDTQRIRQKAIERGLITEHTVLEEHEIQELIFAPGFSTAQAVSALSGRGVGMDAVRSAVRALRGDISIQSVLGEGTIIRIRLPLTLAIIEGLLVELGRSRYVLPLGAVEECIEVPSGAAASRRFTELRGELVPFFSLREWFGAPDDGRSDRQIVVTNVDGQRFGFVVDEVVGQQQTVIKGLGKAYRGVEGISGATILGNGEVALILDPQKIASAIGREEGGRVPAA